ncbi:MAG: zinc-ribbon domain-containing protein [Actinomycetota bacterium]|nr:zinc-ribbon domain-containing protein [Actinomycetota bacterium]
MRDFACPHCGQRLVLDSSVCPSCSHGIGFDLDVMEFAEVDRDGCPPAEPARRICVNLEPAGCNGVVTVASHILLGHRRHEVDHYCVGAPARSLADRAELEAALAEAAASAVARP